MPEARSMEEASLRDVARATASTGERGAHAIAASREARPWRSSPTVRLWFGSLAISLVLLQLSAWIGSMAISAEGSRLLGDPSVLPNLLLGLPHFGLAALFLLASKRLEATRARLWFGFLLVLGVGLAQLFGRLGGHHDRIAFFALAAYFSHHELRDQALFVQTQDGGNESAERRAFGLVRALILVTIVGLGLPAMLYATALRGGSPLTRALFPDAWPIGLRFGAYLVPAILAAAFLASRVHAVMPGGWTALWRKHRALVLLHGAYVTALLLLPAWTGIFGLLVLTHFVAWYLFSARGLKRRRTRPSRGLERLLPSTPARFHLVYLALAALVLSAYLLSLTGRSTPLGAITTAEGFYWLTVVHITLSYMPR